MKKSILSLVISSVFVLSFNASAVENSKPAIDVNKVNDELSKNLPKSSERVEPRQTNMDIKRIQQFPMAGMVMIENAEGEIMFLSDNGRFLFQGTVKDNWSNKTITNFDDADLLSKLPIEKLSKAFQGELAGFEIGKGNKVSYVFFDPLSPHCKDLIRTALTEKENKEHKIKFVYLPVLGAASESATVNLFCENPHDAPQRILEERFSDLKPKPECKTRLDALQKNLATGQVLGVKGVPYLVRHDGTFMAGAPKDFKNWLGITTKDEKKTTGEKK